METPTRGVLEVSFIGYVKQEVSIGGNKHINIILVEDATTLDDVVVIGYGTTKNCRFGIYQHYRCFAR